MSLIRSFKNAVNGIKIVFKNERNFRIHFCVMCYVLLFSTFYNFKVTEYGILFLCFALVMTAEIFNTAIEEVVNSEFEGYHIMAKKAKDMAAGAVFLAAVFSAFVGGMLFFRVDTLIQIAEYFLGKPYMIILLVISFIISFLIVEEVRIRRK